VTKFVEALLQVLKRDIIYRYYQFPDMKHVETQCAENVNFEFVNVNKIFIMQQAVCNLLFFEGKYIYLQSDNRRLDNSENISIY